MSQISPLEVFKNIQTEVQCSKNYFNFSPQEAGAFGNNIEKERLKPRPKLKKYIFADNICSARNPVQVVVSLGSIIP